MFFDRHDAGRQLAARLKHYTRSDAVVYALPRGGVPVGLEVAKALRVPLDLVVARKIGHPLNSEVAICAITEDGVRVCDELGECCIDEAWLASESKAQYTEAKRRRKAYSPQTSLCSANGKVAIIVDDGIATGLTLRAAIGSIKKYAPRKIIIAVPVSPYETSQVIRTMVDEFITIIDDRYYKGAVGAYYEHFGEVTDREVIACLRTARSSYAKHPSKASLLST